MTRLTGEPYVEAGATPARTRAGRASRLSIVSAVCFATLIGTAEAQRRPYTPELSCAAVQAIVARERQIVLATSPNAYELVYVDGGSCGQGMTAVPAFEPTVDDRNCFAGYRCKDRSIDATGVR